MPNWIKEIDSLLRGDATRLESLKQGTVPGNVPALHTGIVVLGLAYGLCMGFYNLLRPDGAWMLQFLSGTVKVPALFLLTLVVTFPSLCVFNALVRSRLPVAALWRLLIATLAVTLAVLASFGPIAAFFSLSTTSYSFMLLLNVLLFSISGFLGLRFLLQTLHRLALAASAVEPVLPPILESSGGGGALERIDGRAPEPRLRLVFRCWVIVFGLVGAQMSWVLRPFLGNPEEPFVLFRGRESNFFESVWRHFHHLF